MMSDNRKSSGFVVSCPKCGKVHQKSITTESIIVCSRCGYEYYLYLKNGVYLGLPASQVDDSQLFGKVRMFASTLDSLFQVESACQEKRM